MKSLLFCIFLTVTHGEPFDVLEASVELLLSFFTVALHVVEVVCHLFELSMKQLHTLLVLAQCRLLHYFASYISAESICQRCSLTFEPFQLLANGLSMLCVVACQHCLDLQLLHVKVFDD